MRGGLAHDSGLIFQVLTKAKNLYLNPAFYVLGTAQSQLVSYFGILILSTLLNMQVIVSVFYRFLFVLIRVLKLV